MGGVVIIILRPGTGGLLDRQAAAPARVVVTVGHGITGPGAVFGVHQAARVVRISCGARPIDHVCEPVQRVVLKGEIGARRIIDEGQVAIVVGRDA